MDPLTLALIGAGLGLGKSVLIDQPQANRDRMVEATTARYSPWTGMQPHQVKEADPFGSTLQGGMAGATLGQGMQQTDAMNTMMKAQRWNQPWLGVPAQSSPYSNPYAPKYA